MNSRALPLPILALLILPLLTACERSTPFVNVEHFQHENGTYRGSFIDSGLIQVSVEFTLEDGIVTEAEFRHLVGVEPQYDWTTDEEPYRSVMQQYEEALQYLVGKALASHLQNLHNPGPIVQTEVDGYSGATIRAIKIISAFRDALQRGVYRY